MNNLIKPNELIYSQFEYAFSIMDKCTDDYIFILDFAEDCYNISESAVKRFPLPCSKFKNVTNVLKNIIHPDDYSMIEENLKEIVEGKTELHNFEYRWKNKDGDYVWISCRGQVVLDKNGKAAYLAGRISEIGSLKRADNITGLLTDIQLNKDYKSYISKNKNAKGYLMRIKIDNFGELNRRYGKSGGNNVLRIVARILENSIANNERPYRYENSNFVIFNYNGGGIDEAKKTYENIRYAVETETENIDYKFFFTISAGVIEFSSEKHNDIEDLYKKSEFAIYLASKKGANNIEIFDKTEYVNYIKRLKIQENLRIDVKNNFEDFELYYQPIIENETKKLVGAEALLRWKSKEYGNMPPVEFVPILEESGLIVPVGKWIFHTAIKQCKFWQEYIPNFKVNINISYVQLRTSDVLNDINKCIKETGLDPKYIVIEITESGHLDMNNALIKGFYEGNFRLAIDDFGTGYSNMRYLQYLNVNTIKIDRSFVERASKNPYDFKIVKHMIDMAHSINLEVCLEGIETEEELSIFEALNPTYIQGYYFGRPVSKDKFFEDNIKK